MKLHSLSLEEIKNLSSSYINDDLKKERWGFLSIEIGPELVLTTASVDLSGLPPENSQNFHLSFFTATEMIGQLLVIYLHHYAGLTLKTREVCVSKVTNKFIKPIKDPENISFILKAKKLHQRKATLICDFECEIKDISGGLFQSEGRVWLI
jgi:hypothetical protein